MTSRSNKTLRFAVGGPTEYRSAVWRLWVQGRDVYLMARVMAGLLKVSMHRSGIWRLAWTSESGIKASHSIDRVEERWMRPAPFRPGWTQGPSVIIPNTEITRPFQRNMVDFSPVVWLPPPASGNQIHLTVLFRDSQLGSMEGSAALPTDIEIGRLDLRGGDRVYLYHRERQMSQKEAEFILPFVKDMRIRYSESIPEQVEASLYSAGTDDAGNPYVLDMALGWENVVST